uniref:Uncharacterized protein n=3 Tax=Physcomitrium patens TaxID=3218 RepID=A9T3I2_PHYPA
MSVAIVRPSGSFNGAGCGGALGLGPKWRGCCSENQSQFQLQTRVRNASIVALDKKALSTNGCGVGGMMWRATKTGSRKVHTDAFIWRKRERALSFDSMGKIHFRQIEFLDYFPEFKGADGRIFSQCSLIWKE